MSKISTPSITQPSASSPAKPRKLQLPNTATLARVRQFARAYTVPVAGFAGIVLN